MPASPAAQQAVLCRTFNLHCQPTTATRSANDRCAHWCLRGRADTASPDVLLQLWAGVNFKLYCSWPVMYTELSLDCDCLVICCPCEYGLQLVRVQHAALALSNGSTTTLLVYLLHRRRCCWAVCRTRTTAAATAPYHTLTALQHPALLSCAQTLFQQTAYGATGKQPACCQRMMQLTLIRMPLAQ